MKFIHLMLAVGLCSFSAASAQTTPSQTSPNTSNPSTVPSGTAPMPSNPNGAVSAGEVFTTGAPKDATGDKRAMKYKKNKGTKPEKGKMKSDM